MRSVAVTEIAKSRKVVLLLPVRIQILPRLRSVVSGARSGALSVVLALCLSTSSDAAETRALAADPLDRWEVDFETGVLWKVGGGATPLDYVVMPQILSLKTPAVAQWAFFGGDLVMRSRFSLLIEPIVKGPESHYIGASASGILEWWDQARTRSLFFSSGGGLGGMDSKGYEVKGAQGQDLNFNWFIYSGARFRGGERWTASVGVYFQHISNTGLDEVNPGLNSLGPMLSVGWDF